MAYEPLSTLSPVNLQEQNTEKSTWPKGLGAKHGPMRKKGVSTKECEPERGLRLTDGRSTCSPLLAQKKSKLERRSSLLTPNCISSLTLLGWEETMS